MHTRILLIASALVLGVLGVVASFLPLEVLTFLQPETDRRVEILVQLLGAALVGFAMLNWTAKGAPAGGIYGRPIVAANLVHFTVAGIALAKLAAVGELAAAGIALTVVYVLFALGFGMAMFGRGPIGAIEHSGPG